MADVSIRVLVEAVGEQELNNLSASLRNVNSALARTVRQNQGITSSQKALNQAVGNTGRGFDNYAKTMRDAGKHQAALSKEIQKTQRELRQLQIAGARGIGADFSKHTKHLNQMAGALKKVKARTLVNDLRGVSLEMRRLGKDAQFVGRSLIIGLTVPMLGIARLGVQSFQSLNRELVRLGKLLGQSAFTSTSGEVKDLNGALKDNSTRMGQIFDQLTDLSQRFGVARELVVAITGDFAELGINSDKALVGLAELSNRVAVLGTMDISQSQGLVQTMFQGTLRSMDQAGIVIENTAKRQERALALVTNQLNMFNSVENATALSFRDLAEGLPEVAGVAVQYGLSFTEMAALLAPMKAAGLDVGASANSIKVSLQRMVAPTKQNAEMLQNLTGVLGEDLRPALDDIKNTGITAIQGLVDVTARLQNVTGDPGLIQFYAKLFGVRQGPRMLIAIQDLVKVQGNLTNLQTTEGRVISRLNNLLSTQANNYGQVGAALGGSIDNFKDMSLISRIANADMEMAIKNAATGGFMIESLGRKVTASEIEQARALRKDVQAQIKEAEKKGVNLIEDIQSEGGKALFIQLAGAASAGELAQKELDVALNSTAVAIDRIKNSFKNFAADLISTFAPVIEKVSAKIVEFTEWFKGLSDNVKIAIASVMALLAAIGPLVFIFGQMKLAVGVVMGAILKLLPSMSALSAAQVASADKMLYLKNGLIRTGDTIVNTNGRFKTFIATLASGNGPVAKLANQFGLMTGMLRKTRTAADDVVASVNTITNQKIASSLGGSTLGQTAAAAGPNFASMVPDTRNEDIARKMRKSGMGPYTAEDVAKMQLTQGPKGPKLRGPDGKFMPKSDAMLFEGYQKQAEATHTRKTKKFERRYKQVMPFYEKKGISFDESGQRIFKDRAISEARADAIAGGGIRSVRARTAESARGVGLKAKDVGSKAFKAATGPARSFNAAVAASKASVASLTARNLAFGNTAPGVFAKARVAALGFGKGLLSASKAMKILKFALISSGIGAIIVGVGIAITLVATNFDKFKQVAQPALTILGQTFTILKDTVWALIAPFADLFASFGVGGEEGEKSVAGLGGALTSIASAVKKVAESIKGFVEKYVVPFISQILDSMRSAISFIINIVKAIIIGLKMLFGKGGKDSGQKLKETLIKALKSLWDYIKKLLITVLQAIIKTIGKLVVFAIRALFNMIAALPRAFGNAIEALAKMIADFIEDSPFGAVLDFLGVDSAIKKVGEIYGSVGRSAADAISTAGDMLANGLESGLDATSNKLGEWFGKNNIEGKGAGLMDDIKDAMASKGDETAEEGLDPFVDSGGEVLDDFADDMQDKIKDAFDNLAQTFIDKVLGKLSDALKQALDQMSDALDAQAAAAAAVYDTQLETLDKLEKAEESITQEMDYQASRRKMIRDRELAMMNYQRNRALAIYEGRVDDARVMDLEEESNRNEFNDSLFKLDTDRRKELAKENLDALREEINKAKQETEKYFEEQKQAFINAAAEIMKYPPLTIQEYDKQLKDLTALGQKFANDNGAEFERMFTQMQATIGSKLPNIGAGVFTTGLDQLVKVAQEKYGLGTGAASDTSIIGATIGMLSGIEGQIVGRRSTILAAFAEMTGGLTAITNADGSLLISATNTNFSKLADDVITPALDKIAKIMEDKNPLKVFAKAIEEANMEILREMEATYGHVASVVDGLSSLIADAVVKAAIAQALREGAGGGGAPPPTPPPDTPFDDEQARKWAISRTESIVYDPTTKQFYNHSIMGTRQVSAFSIPANIANTLTSAEKYNEYRSQLYRYNPGFTPFRYGGKVKGFESQSIPAMLHGGEFIVSAQAVKNVGLGTLQAINDMRFNAVNTRGPAGFSRTTTGTMGSSESSSTSTVNIYVDNFIGQKEWFESMVKDYNVTVLPKNQKDAGLESRVVKTYTGLNRGM